MTSFCGTYALGVSSKLSLHLAKELDKEDLQNSPETAVTTVTTRAPAPPIRGPPRLESRPVLHAGEDCHIE